MCDINNEKQSDYSIEDRIKMWNKTLKMENLLDRVKVIKILRPEYFPEEFNFKFNIRDYDLVFPYVEDTDSDFDKIRNNAFEKILGRKVNYVYPSFTLHTSSIKKNITHLKDWSIYVPRGTYEILLDRNNQTI